MDNQIERVLRLFPDVCQLCGAAPVKITGGFSGAMLWRLQSKRGLLCLRCWPVGHPSQDRLKFIQAVLWHVDQEGFHRISLPVETRHGHGYVLHAGHLWELGPWLPGSADYPQHPSPQRLRNAFRALAEFHHAAASFPLPENGPVASPGMLERRDRLAALAGGHLEKLQSATRRGGWSELAARAQEIVSLAKHAAPSVLPMLEAAAQLPVTLQPCIRDIWSAHVLFEGNEVSGIVDFGSMRPDNVATDIARLLGSLAGDDLQARQRGIEAYQELRGLSHAELRLVHAFDCSTVLMGGLQWLEWIYVDGRTFENRAAVLQRIDQLGTRLRTLANGVSR